MNKSTGNKLNIANILTVFRMVLIFPAVLFVIWPVKFHLVYALLIFLTASYTDHLDGKIARKYEYITDFGKIMDPIADKLMVISVLISFCFCGFCQILPVILISARELLITAVRFLALNKNKKVIAANIFGKLKTLSQITTICFIFLFQIFNELKIFPGNILTFFDFLCIVLLWLSAAFSWISAAVYLLKI